VERQLSRKKPEDLFLEVDDDDDDDDEYCTMLRVT
jgi:hypothetical protein